MEKQLVFAILTYSALPGTSRHHWGTDIDFYSPTLLAPNEKLQLEPWEYQQGGPFYKLTSWLNENSAQYGFYFPYNKYRGGIAYEPWHLSFFPLAGEFEYQLDIKAIKKCINDSDILAKETILNHLDEIYTDFIVNIENIAQYRKH